MCDTWLVSSFLPFLSSLFQLTGVFHSIYISFQDCCRSTDCVVWFLFVLFLNQSVMMLVVSAEPEKGQL